MATFVEQIDAVIATLSLAKEDAAKVDAGKTTSPGTRLRKSAGDAQKALSVLKKGVLDARESQSA
jgi:hypothetical protein